MDGFRPADEAVFDAIALSHDQQWFYELEQFRTSRGLSNKDIETMLETRIDAVEAWRDFWREG